MKEKLIFAMAVVYDWAQDIAIALVILATIFMAIVVGASFK